MFRIVLFALLFALVSCSSPIHTSPKPTDPLVTLAKSSSSSKREIATLERMGLAPKWEYAQKVPLDGLDYVLVLTKNVNYQLHYAFKGTELVSSKLFVIEVNTKDLQQVVLYDLLARRADRIQANPVTKIATSLESFESGYGSEFADSLSKQATRPGCIVPASAPGLSSLAVRPNPSPAPVPTPPAPTPCHEPGQPAQPSPPETPDKPEKPGDETRPGQPSAPCELPESLKLAITAAEKSIKSATRSLEAARESLEQAQQTIVTGYIAAGGAVGSGLVAVGTLPACLTGAGCVVPAMSATSGVITIGTAIASLKTGHGATKTAHKNIAAVTEGLEAARISLRSAQSAATEWKSSNCRGGN
jgi:hypothetical protein